MALSRPFKEDRLVVFISPVGNYFSAPFGMFRVPSYVLFATSHTVIYTDRSVCLYSNSATKSGLFCAICDTISRMRSDWEIDVYLSLIHI